LGTRSHYRKGKRIENRTFQTGEKHLKKHRFKYGLGKEGHYKEDWKEAYLRQLKEK